VARLHFSQISFGCVVALPDYSTRVLFLPLVILTQWGRQPFHRGWPEEMADIAVVDVQTSVVDEPCISSERGMEK
jgi:hypothetical protein